jgi:hypothetical protein
MNELIRVKLILVPSNFALPAIPAATGRAIQGRALLRQEEPQSSEQLAI